MTNKFLILAFVFISLTCLAQPVSETYLSTRVVNGHSVEILDKNEFQYRIEHRFGDFAGDFGGVQTAFGFDNAADIRFAFEYGVFKNAMIGVGRSKGNGIPYRSLLDGLFKYKICTQNKEKGIPVSISALGTMSYTYMTKITDTFQISAFPEWYHRLAYSSQILIARKLTERGSIGFNPTYVWRNYVGNDDENGVFAVGVNLNLKLSKKWGLLAEYYHVFSNAPIRDFRQNSLSFAIEYQTNGHNFHFLIANATGIGETQFITNTDTNWLDGAFRIGFCISRNYKLKL